MKLLVIPSAEIACILQQADTILIASWSTTSTLHSIDLAESFFSDLITVSIISANEMLRKYRTIIIFVSKPANGTETFGINLLWLTKPLRAIFSNLIFSS